MKIACKEALVESVDTYNEPSKRKNASLANLTFSSLPKKRIPKILPDDLIEHWTCHLAGFATKKELLRSMIIDEYQKKNPGITLYRTEYGSYVYKEDFFVVIYEDIYFMTGVDRIGRDLIAHWTQCDPRGKLAMRLKIISSFSRAIRKIATPRTEFIRDIYIKHVRDVTRDTVERAVDRLIDETGIDKQKVKKRASGKLGPV